MTTEIGVIFDCANPEVTADFWVQALEYVREGSGDEYAAIIDPAGRRPRILFQQVPEPKAVKNRVQLDLHGADMAAQVEQLLALGGTRLRTGEDEDGDIWTVMADPEGNEFCVA
ncbi:MAG: VOC family protein [Chloroflexota bacterium]|nr:VOC family protein [Chloroflexota bacterium]